MQTMRLQSIVNSFKTIIFTKDVGKYARQLMNRKLLVYGREWEGIGIILREWGGNGRNS